MYILRLLYNIPFAIFCLIAYVLAGIGKEPHQKNRNLGIWMRRFFIHMGPMYVKIGQVMSTRSDLLSKETIQELKILQDDVPSQGKPYVKKLLESEFKQPINEVFSSFDFTPVASASIAQVHCGVLKNGEKVAVKIVKKDVKKQLSRNLRTLGIIVNVFHFLIPPIKIYNFPGRITEFGRLLIEQTSMLNEAKNQGILYKNFKDHPFVIIPKLYKDLSSDQLLVMEFVDGIKGSDFEKVECSGETLAHRLQDIIYTMLYIDGVCHGDPHPGNIFFTKDGTYIFVDFGITAYLTETEKWGLSSFYYAATRYEWELAVKRFTKYFVVCEKKLIEDNSYVEKMKAVIKHHFYDISDKWSTANFFKDVYDVLKHFGATYTTCFTKAELALTSCEGYAIQMEPNLDIWENARKFSDHYSPYISEEVKKNFDQFFEKTIPKSLEMRQRGKETLVASTHLDRYFFPSEYPLFIKRAVGSKIVDVDDNEYIDLSCGYGPHILGYGHPSVVNALTEAAPNINFNAIAHEKELELADLLVDAFPGADKAIFSNSGTESTIHAMRLCRAFNNRKKIAKFEGHYHGFSDQAMISSWFRVKGSLQSPEPIAGCRGTMQEFEDNTIVLQFGHPNSIQQIRQHAHELSCVIVEPMQAGSDSFNKEYLVSLRNVCDDLSIPLVFDEIVTGFRVSYGGIQTLTGVTPDLTCLGKVIGGGLPCGAVVGKRELVDVGKTSGDPFVDYEEKVFLGGTLSGNYLTCVSGLAVLRHLKNNPDIYLQFEENTRWLKDEFKSIGDKYSIPLKVKGYRSMFSVLFTYKDTAYFREAFQGCNFKATMALAYYMRTNGVYMPELHGFLISAAHTKKNLEFIVAAFEKSVKSLIADKFFVF